MYSTTNQAQTQNITNILPAFSELVQSIFPNPVDYLIDSSSKYPQDNEHSNFDYKLHNVMTGQPLPSSPVLINHETQYICKTNNHNNIDSNNQLQNQLQFQNYNNKNQNHNYSYNTNNNNNYNHLNNTHTILNSNKQYNNYSNQTNYNYQTNNQINYIHDYKNYNNNNNNNNNNYNNYINNNTSNYNYTNNNNTQYYNNNTNYNYQLQPREEDITIIDDNPNKRYY